MKENSIFFPVVVVIFLAVLLAYGVSWYARSNSDLSSKISEEQLASFTADVEYVELPPVGSEEIIASPVESRQRQAPPKFEVGKVVKSLNIGNIATATPEDLRLIGETEWSLTNTVASNLNYPQVIEVLFNNKNILDGFFSREGVMSLANDYMSVTDLVENNSTEISDLVESRAVTGVLKDKELMTKLLNSALIQEILLGRSANYFLSSPAETKKLIENNKTLAPLLKDENLKDVLLNDEKTKGFAQVVFAE